MAQIQLTTAGAHQMPLAKTFDIAGIVAEAFGGFINYISFNTDGTMAALRAQNGVIVAWDHFLPDGTYLQQATASLPLQPFLDILNGPNGSSVRAVNYLMSGDDTITGSRAGDVLDGRGGADTLLGLKGADRMLGGAGDDVLSGGLGHDRATGGAGADSFNFASILDGRDTIRDFQHGVDHIGLDAAAFGFSAPLADGVDFIDLSGGGAVTGAAQCWSMTNPQGAGYDADGAGVGTARLLATLANHSALTASDILLL